MAALHLFKTTFPGDDLYPHNIYGATSAVLIALMLVHFLAAVLAVPVSPESPLNDYHPVDAIPLDDLESTPVMVVVAHSARGSPSPSSNRDTLCSLSSAVKSQSLFLSVSNSINCPIL